MDSYFEQNTTDNNLHCIQYRKVPASAWLFIQGKCLLFGWRASVSEAITSLRSALPIVLAMPNEEMWLLQTTDVPRWRRHTSLDDFTTLLRRMRSRPPTDADLPVLTSYRFQVGTTEHRSSNQLLRRFTKSKSTCQADNPAVLSGVFSKQLEQSSPFLVDDISPNVSWPQSTSCHFKLSPVLSRLLFSDGPRYCY